MRMTRGKRIIHARHAHRAVLKRLGLQTLRTRAETEGRGKTFEPLVPRVFLASFRTSRAETPKELICCDQVETGDKAGLIVTRVTGTTGHNQSSFVLLSQPGDNKSTSFSQQSNSKNKKHVPLQDLASVQTLCRYVVRACSY